VPGLVAVALRAGAVEDELSLRLEVVEDGKTGILVPPGRPDELATALRKVLDDPAMGRAMGRAGRKRVEAKFSWASVAARTEEVYGDAVDEFKRSAGD
jgi:glycosyltransferase involved in cell wall biosynthesis